MNTMKKLTRVRLINWHYFCDETLCLGGSTLVSGENTAGKSTVLDAIQLVLTTNTRKFNAAANEKSNRDLKGYVRCKTGNVGQTYLRKNAVIANVALEFYEEKADRYFVLGVHMTSPDEESRVIAKWYTEECRLEGLSFINGKRPSLADEFRRNGNKIKYIEQVGAAKDRFKRRMGNLEDRFFDIVPKSLAFKPMDNVKDFINKFILPEATVDIGYLRTNIETLSELEDLFAKSQEKLNILNCIIDRYEEINSKEKEFVVSDLMIRIAELGNLKENTEVLLNTIHNNEQFIENGEKQQENLAEQQKTINKRLIQLGIAKESNETGKLISESERTLRELADKRKEQQEKKNQLLAEMKKLEKLISLFYERNDKIVSREKFASLANEIALDIKVPLMTDIEGQIKKLIEEYRKQKYSLDNRIREIDIETGDLQRRIEDLQKKVFHFPEQTERLKAAVEKEFTSKGIHSKVWVVSELLEVTDSKWQNAVEGYFNTQKFNLIVEPEYFQTALTVYRKMRQSIHTAGLVNTNKLKTDYDLDRESLAYVVHSENRYAKAYANYILGRVRRCKEISELEKYNIAITSECMLYQGYVVRNLDKESYRNPFIGAKAFEIQVNNARKEMTSLKTEKESLLMKQNEAGTILQAFESCNLNRIRENMDAPNILKSIGASIQEEEKNLKKARQDPNYIQITMQIEENEIEKDRLEGIKKKIQQDTSDQKSINITYKENIKNNIKQEQEKGKELEHLFSQYAKEREEATLKYEQNRKIKTDKMIVDGFIPKRSQYYNEKQAMLYEGKNSLVSLQGEFNHKYDLDYTTGVKEINDYFEAKYSLESAEMIKYEEELKKAKEDCEQIFRVSFLAKMKENIEGAKLEFKNLNKALQDIYYGEDSYHFEITYDKKKESLYRMITADSNMEGYHLWSAAFEEEYKEEMSDLFAKLIAKDDSGEKVLAEYTDYRSYLDYDIEVRKVNGTVQKFSVIYGEKSGGETQTPYYVAIAASFYQLYKMDNTIRLILLDEAFDKMDDNRIASMMDFFNGLGLQVILATPPAKMEIIGEKVTTILMAIRNGNGSIIQEYNL